MSSKLHQSPCGLFCANILDISHRSCIESLRGIPHIWIFLIILGIFLGCKVAMSCTQYPRLQLDVLCLIVCIIERGIHSDGLDNNLTENSNTSLISKLP